MAEKRPFADFSRFSFVEGDSIPETKTPDQDHVCENKRAKILPTLPSKTQSKQIEVDKVQTPLVGGLSELYKSNGCVERPLKLLIVGHNPSDQSWSKGHYYANPNNRMWFLLGKAGIVPSGFKADCDKRCPDELGLGFTDVMSGIPDTQSCNITDAALKSNKGTFFRRLEAHTQRAASECNIPVEDAYPRIIAFAGVRQWKALFPSGYFDDTGTTVKKERAIAKNQPLLTNMFSSSKSSAVRESAVTEKVATEALGNEVVVESSGGSKARQSSIPYGVQTQKPEGWPSALRQSVVFLLPSSSGAAALSNAEREGPYLELGRLLREEERFRWQAGVGFSGQVCSSPKGRDSAEFKSEKKVNETDEVVVSHARQECIDLSDSPVGPPQPSSSFAMFGCEVIDLSDS